MIRHWFAFSRNDDLPFMVTLMGLTVDELLDISASNSFLLTHLGMGLSHDPLRRQVSHVGPSTLNVLDRQDIFTLVPDSLLYVLNWSEFMFAIVIILYSFARTGHRFIFSEMKNIFFLSKYTKY